MSYSFDHLQIVTESTLVENVVRLGIYLYAHSFLSVGMVLVAWLENSERQALRLSGKEVKQPRTPTAKRC